MATSKWRRQLEAQATTLGCTLKAGKNASYASGYVIVAPDGSSKWLFSLQAVDKFLRSYDQSEPLRQIMRANR